MDIIIESSIENPERVERRREQIIEAAVRCFAADGYHRATIKDIADAAGFSSGLIYSYVKDKEDVLFLVFTSIFRTYQRAIPARLEGVTDPLLRFCTAVRAYCEAVDGNLGATVVGYRESGSLRSELLKAIQKLELETNKLVSDPIDECIKAGYFRPVNLDLVTFRLVFLAHGWALKHWHFAKIISLDGYIEEGLNSFLNDLLTAAGRKHWQTLLEAGTGSEPVHPVRPSRSGKKRSAAKRPTKRLRSAR